MPFGRSLVPLERTGAVEPPRRIAGRTTRLAQRGALPEAGAPVRLRLPVWAPINDFFQPLTRVSEGQAVITTKVRRDFFHAANAVHGVLSFKMLDDAAGVRSSCAVAPALRRVYDGEPE